MLHYLKHVATVLVAVGVLATPAVAQEPNGYPITDVNLRAGPGTQYPILVTVQSDAPITILGCLEDYTWCDTIFEQHRGWMRSIYLAGYYDGQYYLLSDYAPDLGYQTVTFDIAAYWDAYYRDEPFYNDQYRVTEARGEDWVDDGVFYDRLSPYGSWTWTEGQYVWVPAGVDAGWRPYTRGRWVYTDYGWTWESYEPFGWATFHYGRWGFSSRIGWFWVPGNRWGPAWVSWRQSDDYLAWAPLPPAYDRGGLSINISFGAIPGYYWSVVPSRYFLADDLPRYYVRDRARWRNAYDRTRLIGHTTIVNKTVVNKVVNVGYVERHTNEKVAERKVRRTRDWDSAGKVRGDAYEVYRPGLREGRGRRAPENPRQLDEVARLSKTKGEARGEATTEEMLAPPEVRDAIKKRKGGRVSGELSRGETGGPKFDRRLPRGRDAEGPPPAAKRAKVQPVPAQDLGRSPGGSKGKLPRQRGPAAGGEKAISSPDRKKVPPSAGTTGSRVKAPAGAPAEAAKERRRRTEPQRPSPQKGAEGGTRTEPTSDQGVKGGQRGQPRQRKASPKGKPEELRGPSDRSPPANRAPIKRKVEPKEQKAPQAQQRKRSGSEKKASSKREPAVKKASPKRKAQPKKQNVPQAQQGKRSQSGKKASSKRKPGAKKAGPKRKAPPQTRGKKSGGGKKASSGKQNKKKKKNNRKKR